MIHTFARYIFLNVNVMNLAGIEAQQADFFQHLTIKPPAHCVVWYMVFTYDVYILHSPIFEVISDFSIDCWRTLEKKKEFRYMILFSCFQTNYQYYHLIFWKSICWHSAHWRRKLNTFIRKFLKRKKSNKINT